MCKFVPVKCIKGPVHRTDKKLSITNKVNTDISITVDLKNNGVDMLKIHEYSAYPFCFDIKSISSIEIYAKNDQI